MDDSVGVKGGGGGGWVCEWYVRDRIGFVGNLGGNDGLREGLRSGRRDCILVAIVVVVGCWERKIRDGSG